MLRNDEICAFRYIVSEMHFKINFAYKVRICISLHHKDHNLNILGHKSNFFHCQLFSKDSINVLQLMI